ncbi:MAG: BatA domain-containing protein [Lentimicrobiaceae bacterium]|nr:BatA domain-containing protein [Lentimicrobiaceae bacterium]MCO5265298.1 BatA domain-containing protein [Lentimicrobium sp.]
MLFINPYLLFGLFAVLIPIAIHLFNFRKYRKVYFSNVRFLRELQQKTQKQSRLLHLLVLLLRILTIVFLVLAFAQPYLPSATKTAPGQISVVSIFIDNSFSMEASGTKGRLIDEAKMAASEIAAAYKPDDLFQLLTNDFEGKHQRLVTKDEFIEMLKDVKPSPSVRSLAEIAPRQADLLNAHRTPSKSAYIISDFQQSTIMAHWPETTEGIAFYAVPIQSANTNNLYIDSCWFENPFIRLNQTVKLMASVKNTATSDLEKIPLKLMINGQQRAVASVSVKAGGNTLIELPFNNTQAGIIQGMVEISDYPVTYDDNYYFTFRVSDKIPVLAINSKDDNAYLHSVFALDSVIDFSTIQAKQTDYSTLSNYPLIILNDVEQLSSGAIQELIKYTNQGGNLFIFPSLGADLNSLNQLLASLKTDQLIKIDSARSAVASVNMKHSIFKDVFEKQGLSEENTDLPFISRHFKISASSTGSSEVLMTLNNGDPFLITTNTGEGRVYLCAVPARDNAGNWPRHALFVPAMLNIAFNSGHPVPMMYYTGTSEGINLGNIRPAEDNIFKISANNESNAFIPEFRRMEGQSVIFMNDQIKEAGIYQVLSGQKLATQLAFNYNRNESDLSLADNSAIEKLAEEHKEFTILTPGGKPLNEIISDSQQKKELWKWLIIAALLCIAGEVILLRTFRKNKAVSA